MDGIRNHLWVALKNAISQWFNDKVESAARPRQVGLEPAHQGRDRDGPGRQDGLGGDQGRDPGRADRDPRRAPRLDDRPRRRRGDGDRPGPDGRVGRDPAHPGRDRPLHRLPEGRQVRQRRPRLRPGARGRRRRRDRVRQPVPAAQDRRRRLQGRGQDQGDRPEDRQAPDGRHQEGRQGDQEGRQARSRRKAKQGSRRRSSARRRRRPRRRRSRTSRSALDKAVAALRPKIMALRPQRHDERLRLKAQLLSGASCTSSSACGSSKKRRARRVKAQVNPFADVGRQQSSTARAAAPARCTARREDARAARPSRRRCRSRPPRARRAAKAPTGPPREAAAARRRGGRARAPSEASSAARSASSQMRQTTGWASTGSRRQTSGEHERGRPGTRRPTRRSHGDRGQRPHDARTAIARCLEACSTGHARRERMHPAQAHADALPEQADAARASHRSRGPRRDGADDARPDVRRSTWRCNRARSPRASWPGDGGHDGRRRAGRPDSSMTRCAAAAARRRRTTRTGPMRGKPGAHGRRPSGAQLRESSRDDGHPLARGAGEGRAGRCSATTQSAEDLPRQAREDDLLDEAGGDCSMSRQEPRRARPAVSSDDVDRAATSSTGTRPGARLGGPANAATRTTCTWHATDDDAPCSCGQRRRDRRAVPRSSTGRAPTRSPRAPRQLDTMLAPTDCRRRSRTRSRASDERAHGALPARRTAAPGKADRAVVELIAATSTTTTPIVAPRPRWSRRGITRLARSSSRSSAMAQGRRRTTRSARRRATPGLRDALTATPPRIAASTWQDAGWKDWSGSWGSTPSSRRPTGTSAPPSITRSAWWRRYALGLTPIVFLITGIFFLCTAATYAEATRCTRRRAARAPSPGARSTSSGRSSPPGARCSTTW